MTPNAQPKVCLDVAIDHRMRRLFEPVPIDLTEPSDHVSRIEARGRSLKRPSDEVKVTAQLAGPSFKGGIAIVLQQPRNNHPFGKGLDAVVEDCESLSALSDIFTTVSCGTLDIRTDIAIIDLLPYVAENVGKVHDDYLKESFHVSTQAICDKEPEVLLCAGKIWLPKAGRFDNRKGEAWKLENVGVGVKLGSNPKLPIKTRIRHENNGLVTISKVNGFHPSYAMNYHSHVSLLRQLQILIGVETCRTLRGDWEDEQWMEDLRRRCQNISNSISTPSPKSPPPPSPSQRSVGRYSTKYLPEYQELYSDKLLDLGKSTCSLISGTRSTKKSPTATYDFLLSSGLSEICNDATLILRQMARLQRKGWPESVAWKNEAALNEAATETLQLSENLVKAAKQGRGTQLASVIQQGAKCILTNVNGKKPDYQLDLDGACDAFLELAADIETLLFDLLVEKEEALNALGQEEILSAMLGEMKLAPKAAVTVIPAMPVPAPF
ncbi:hypothetical protein BGZ63DRAFT_417208 [Mariannaea sp. PMI_226]|nr:hypothetical protein BGZ63DRAFT_417208 [Mariannaea sp. PMI_226]